MSVIGDLRYALRALARHPSFSLAAIAMLAIGITTNTIAFTLIDSLALRPMPVRDASRVVRIYPVDANGRRSNLISYPDYVDYRNQTPGFDALAAYIPAEATSGRWSGDGGGSASARGILAYVASTEYFAVVGMQPALGRVLLPTDEQPGAAPVAVIGYAFWQSRFNADPAVIGSELIVNGRAFAIVGVAPAGFVGTEPLVADVWVPLSAHQIVLPKETSFEDRAATSLLVIGRLARGTSWASARSALSVVAGRLGTAFPGPSRPEDIALEAGTFFTVDPGARPLIAIVMGTVGLVLCIACANVANLMLARAASRQREMAIRIAIGAGRWRIVRQLLIEALGLSVVAGGMALLLSGWILRVLYTLGLSLAPFPWTIALSLSPDVRVFAYTFGLAVVAAVLFGLFPSLQISSLRITQALHDGGTVLGVRVSRSRIRHALVIAQLAGCLVLLVDAGLLTRGLRNARALDLGFRADHVVYSEYDLRQLGYSRPRADAFNAALLDRASRVPGVASLALTSHVPLHGGVRRTQVTFEAGGGRELAWSIYSTVTSTYFETLSIPIVEGRNFAGEDANAPVVIISEGLARRFWPGETAVGRVINLEERPQPRTVIGVVRDASNGAIWREKELSVYLPIDGSADGRDLQLIARTTIEPSVVLPALRAVANELDPDLRFTATPLDRLLQFWILPSRAAAGGAGVLGLVAVVLAALGIYAVIAFAVSHRVKELGIRMALGADAKDVLGLVLREGGRLIGTGLVVGTIAACASAPLLGRMLFGISAFDPVTYLVVTIFLGAVALAACYIPARRAAALEPVIALRSE
jgi:macrolide transport system ATP-binding/permease protein